MRGGKRQPHLERVDRIAEVFGGEEGRHVGSVGGDGDEDKEGEADCENAL